MNLLTTKLNGETPSLRYQRNETKPEPKICDARGLERVITIRIDQITIRVKAKKVDQDPIWTGLERNRMAFSLWHVDESLSRAKSAFVLPA